MSVPFMQKYFWHFPIIKAAFQKAAFLFAGSRAPPFSLDALKTNDYPTLAQKHLSGADSWLMS